MNIPLICVTYESDGSLFDIPMASYVKSNICNKIP